MAKSLLKFAKDCKYYVISNKQKRLATFSSVKQVEDYIKDHPNVFKIIYRREFSVNGKTFEELDEEEKNCLLNTNLFVASILVTRENYSKADFLKTFFCHSGFYTN